MAQLARSLVALRIMGERLDPDEITGKLGVEPTSCQRKGEVRVSKKSGLRREIKFGNWILDADEREPEDLNGQIREILGKLPGDLNVWTALADEYSLDLFCGLFMKVSNEGMLVSSESLAALGERHIALSLDVYDGHDEPLKPTDACPCGSGKVYGDCCGKGLTERIASA